LSDSILHTNRNVITDIDVADLFTLTSSRTLYTSASAMQGGRLAGGLGLALPAKALKVGQEDYWLD
jgi:hypothetical protein